MIAGIFEDILGVNPVGIEDNFFEMGGDSIKAIRVVSKMREAGYELSVKDLMQLHIVKLIAEKAVTAKKIMAYEQGEVSGQVPMTPIQRTFFGWGYVKAHHFNQAIMLYCKEGFETEALKQSLKMLVIHHDALRSVYGEGTQRILPIGQCKMFDWSEFDLYAANNVREVVEQESTKLQSSIDMEYGPLMKAGLFHTADGDHLLLCIHHLVVDGVSWRILLEDLTNGYEQALEGKEIILPAKTASYKDWAEVLVEYAQSSELKQETKYWKEVCEKAKIGEIQGDVNSSSREYAHMTLELGQESTRQLLYEAGKAYGTEINDLLLSALGMATKQWSGQNCVTVELEGHGREETHKAIDIDRTVGWFTSIYPIVLEAGEDTESTIINTKEMLRRIPNHGIGYGVAKQLGQCEWLDVEADLCFNYLGHMDNDLSAKGRMTASSLSGGISIAEENIPVQGIAMNGSVSGGKLCFDIAYNEGKYSKQSMEQFCKCYVQSMETIVQYCASKKETVKTASDFGSIGLTQDVLEELNDIFG